MPGVPDTPEPAGGTEDTCEVEFAAGAGFTAGVGGAVRRVGPKAGRSEGSGSMISGGLGRLGGGSWDAAFPASMSHTGRAKAMRRKQGCRWR